MKALKLSHPSVFQSSHTKETILIPQRLSMENLYLADKTSMSNDQKKKNYFFNNIHDLEVSGILLFFPSD